MSESVVNLLLAFCYLVIIALVAGIISYFLMKQQAKRLKTVFVRASDLYDKQKRCIKPIRIALLSDFHIPKMPPSKNAIVSAVANNSPDCVVIAGDLCADKKCINETAGFVASVAEECNCPVIIVLGNHDILDTCEKNKTKINEYRQILENSHCNIVTLVDEKFVFECRSADRKILFGGLNDYRFTSPGKISECVDKWKAEAEYSDEDFVLISHNPDAAVCVREKSYPLILLSGHTHAGQVWLPFNIEFRLMRKDILPRQGYKYGIHMYEKKFPIYITSGTGCSFLPIRFRSNAEVAIIDI